MNFKIYDVTLACPQAEQREEM